MIYTQKVFFLPKKNERFILVSIETLISLMKVGDQNFGIVVMLEASHRFSLHN